MNTPKKHSRKLSTRLTVLIIAALMLFNFLAPTYVGYLALGIRPASAQSGDQEPVEAPTGEEGNIACYDSSPEETSAWNDVKDLAVGTAKVAVPSFGVLSWGAGKLGGVYDFAKDPLKWFVCGVSKLMTNAIDFINILITRLMLFDPTKNTLEVEQAYKQDCIDSTTADEDCYKLAGLTTDGLNGLKSVWRSILNVSNIILILAFMIMVISTALDLGIFNAYTVKKMLPRIVIAAIAANLSWVIVSVVISGVNYIGIGIQSVLIAPFTGGVSTSLASAASAVSGTAIDQGGVVFQGGVLIAIGSIVFFIFATGGAILLPLLAIVLVAILVGFIVFLLRRIVLLMLVMVAPLAFMAWAIPGGDQWFKKWWKTLIQTLLIYPYAMVLLGSGIVIANVIGETGGKGNAEQVLNSFLIIIALILPYFLLPTAFKMIGGALGTLTGKLNDRSKGLIDRARNSKENSAYYAGKKGAKDAKLSGKKQEATAERVNKYMNGRGLGSKLYRRGMSDTQQARLEAGANKAMVDSEVEGYTQRGSSAEELKADALNSSLSKNQRAGAMKALALQGHAKELAELTHDLRDQAQAGDVSGADIYDETLRNNYGDFKGATPVASVGMRDKDGNLHTDGSLRQAQAAKLNGLSLKDRANMSEKEWSSFNAVNPVAAQQAHADLMNNAQSDPGLNREIKYSTWAFGSATGSTPSGGPSPGAGTGVPTAALGGTGPGSVRPSGLWTPGTGTGPTPGGGTPPPPPPGPGPNPFGGGGTPPAPPTPPAGGGTPPPPPGPGPNPFSGGGTPPPSTP